MSGHVVASKAVSERHVILRERSGVDRLYPLHPTMRYQLLTNDWRIRLFAWNGNERTLTGTRVYRQFGKDRRVP